MIFEKNRPEQLEHAYESHTATVKRESKIQMQQKST